MGVSFQRSHDIMIDAPPAAVYDYVCNPNSWPEWLAASHHIDGEDRPLLQGETFREQWHIKRGEVHVLKDAMEQSAVDGCQTFDSALYELCASGRIDELSALKNADSFPAVTRRPTRGNIEVGRQAAEATGVRNDPGHRGTVA